MVDLSDADSVNKSVEQLFAVHWVNAICAYCNSTDVD